MRGGAEPEGPQTHQTPAPDGAAHEDQYDLKLTKVELSDLHARLIALESLAISLLFTASDQQLELAREMADHISPREGHTPHPLTRIRIAFASACPDAALFRIIASALKPAPT